MREIYLRVDKPLLQGIKPHEFMEMDSFRKDLSVDLVPRGNALINFPYSQLIRANHIYDIETMYKKYGISYTGFMPQIFIGKEIILLNYYGSIFEVDEENEVLIQLDYEKSMNSRQHFTFIDNGHVWYLVNPVYTIECIDGVITQYPVGIETGLFFKNRFIFAGFTPPSTLSQYSMFDKLDKTSIWWSTVGGGFTTHQFQSSIDDLTYLKRYDLGFASVEGEVVKMIEFKDKFILATTKAVYLGDVLVGDIVTLSLSKILDYGIKDKCIEVLNGTIYLISSADNLMVFDGQEFKDLDYIHIFKDLSNLYMLPNKKRQELYICNGKDSFVLKENNLYPLSKSISAVTTI